MGAEAERLSRAARYVRGQMDDAERMRAERDLEFDSNFRAAVVAIAEHMHLFDVAQEETPKDWRTVATHLSGLPHMRLVSVPTPEAAAPISKAPPRSRRLPDPTETSAAERRSIKVLMVSIALAFVVGFVAGTLSRAL